MATSRLDNNSRDLLSFRPTITFVEPDIIAEEPSAVVADIAATELDNALANKNKAYELANVVEKLATATQIRVDQRADAAIAALDSKVDGLVIQAMRREFPGDDPTVITYRQYKTCREKISKLGEKIASKAIMSQDKIDAAANTPLYELGGFGTQEGRDGRLRPEADSDAQIIEPLDMNDFQSDTVKALANVLWKNMVRPMLIIALPPPAGLLLPKNIFPEKSLDFPDNFLDNSEESTVKLQNEETRKTEAVKKLSRTLVENKNRFNRFELQDCQVITKAFERSAAFSQTEESVFALLTPHLQTMITQSKAAKNQINSYGVYASKKDLQDQIGDDLLKSTQNLTAPPYGEEGEQINVENLGSGNENSEPLFTDFVPVNPSTGKREWNRIFDSNCIPCGLRISLANQAFAGLAVEGDLLFKHMINWFMQQKRYIDDMIQFLKGIQPTDLCVLIGILTDFVCVPDLARILSLLSTSMLKLSLELSATFDLATTLIAPLVTPFISGLVSMIHQFILMIVRPVECVIDALLAMIRKLDYNVLFDMAVNLNLQIDPSVPGAALTLEAGNLAGPNPPTITSAENIARQELQKEIDSTESNLQTARTSLSNTDVSDGEALEAAGSRVKNIGVTLRQQKAVQIESALGPVVSALESTRPMLYQLIDYLNEIMQSITGFELKLVSELQKLQGSYLGGTASSLSINFRKLGLIQMMQLIAALIQLFNQKPNCSPEEATESAISKLSNDTFTFYTDDEGNVHVDENQDNIDDVIDDVIIALGGQDGGTKVESTGDPLLDIEISETVDALTSPATTIFRCSLQTSTADAEKVNQWVDELNAE